MEKNIRPNILITEPGDYSQQAIAAYQQWGNVELLPELSLLPQYLPEATILVTRLGVHFTQHLLQQATCLRCIVTPTTGLDHIDVAFATHRNIQIISLQGETAFLENIPSTAEHTWALLLACVRNLVPAVKDVLNGHWNRDAWKGQNLKEKTIGIIGMGRVGKHVAQFANAFQMKVLAFDTDRHKTFPDFVEKAATVEYLLQHSDVVSLHIPAHGNDDFLSADLLQFVKQGAILLNTSRGNVWNEVTIATLVQSNHISTVGADVISTELLSDQWQQNALVKAAATCNRIIITPHIAGATYESMHATEEFVAEKCTNWWYENQ